MFDGVSASFPFSGSFLKFPAAHLFPDHEPPLWLPFWMECQINHTMYGSSGHAFCQ
jgi:hypothetical protein